MSWSVMDDEVQALGWVPLEGRGSLPFSLVHGESLVAAASWAVGEAGVQLFDASVTFDQVRDAGRPLLLHDPLCPLTPADFLAEAVARSLAEDRVVVGFRPVTDTVKRRDGELLGETVDRTALRSIASPVVVPSRVLATRASLDTSDLRVHAVDGEVANLKVTFAEDLALAEQLIATGRPGNG